MQQCSQDLLNLVGFITIWEALVTEWEEVTGKFKMFLTVLVWVRGNCSRGEGHLCTVYPQSLSVCTATAQELRMREVWKSLRWKVMWKP
jgi:hypothetical protein